MARDALIVLILLSLLTPLSRPPGVAAQQADLAGTWVMVKAESTGPDDGRTDNIRTFIPATEIGITARGDTLLLEYRAWDDGRGRRAPGEWRRQTWIVDGLPHPEPTDETITFTCRREGDTLTILRSQKVSMGFTSRTMESRRVWRLTQGGTKLIVEEWLPSSLTSGPPAAHSVYRKTTGR